MMSRNRAAPPMNDRSHRRWAGLLVLGLGVALIVVDITIVNVAMPLIVANLDLDFVDAEWVNVIYAAVFASFLITLGRVGDIVGNRRLFVMGNMAFFAASLAAAQADSLGALLGARALQGLGAAMILPATLALTNANFRGRERSIAFGIWGAVIGGMAAVGPVLGGWLTTAFGWRWIFIMNLPIAAVLALAAMALIEESTRETRPGFDISGSVLAALGLLGLVLGVIEGPRYGWFRVSENLEIMGWVWPLEVSIAPLALLVGSVTLALFVVLENRRLHSGQTVLFDLRLFGIPSFLRGNLLALVIGLGEFGLIFVVPLYLQTAVGVSALRTGLLILAMAVGGFVGGPMAGVLARRFGPRQIVTVGLGLEALGALGVALSVAPSQIVPGLGVSLFVYGVGLGFASSQLASLILAEIPVAASGEASGMQSTFRQVGATLGIALLGTVFVTAMGQETLDRLDAIDGLIDSQRARIVESLTDSAGWYIHGLRGWTPDFEVVVRAAESGIAVAASYAALAASVIFMGGTLLSRFLPDILSESREKSEK